MLGLLPTEAWYYSIMDLFIGIRSALRRHGSIESLLIPGLGYGIPVRSARAGVIISLRAAKLRPGTKIGVPLYCCPVVFKAIKAAGYYPRFIDIDPETFCMSSLDLIDKRHEIGAVIAVHMFGHMCDMDAILRIMGNDPVFEDCAQSVGSRYSGQAAGSMGRVGIFSFHSGKYLSAGEGGAIWSRDADFIADVAGQTSVLSETSIPTEVQHVFEIYIRSKLRGKLMWGPIGSEIWKIYNRNVEFVDKSPISMGRMYRSDMAIIRQRMTRLDSMISTQRENADYYDRNLTIDSSMLYRERPGHVVNRFMYPIRFGSTKQRNRVAAFLKENGIGTSTPYEDVIEGARDHYGYEGDCPKAESVLRRTLVIPNHFKVIPRERKRIAKCINAIWRRVCDEA
jgi:perosamine synthetase